MSQKFFSDPKLTEDNRDVGGFFIILMILFMLCVL